MRIVTSVGRVLFVITDAALKRANDGAERLRQKHWFREGTARLGIMMVKEAIAVCSRQVGSSGRSIQTGGGWCWVAGRASHVSVVSVMR